MDLTMLRLRTSQVLALTVAAAGWMASPPALAGDPVAGKAIFGQCLACHTVEPGAADGVGPNLRGVLGKPAATNRPGYAYSEALKAAKLTWDDATLDTWIKNPVAMVPGSKMEFVGLSKRDKREDVIAYMKDALK
jgi:cytochrome c